MSSDKDGLDEMNDLRDALDAMREKEHQRRQERDEAVGCLLALFEFPGVKDLLAPSGSLFSLRDQVAAVLAKARGGK